MSITPEKLAELGFKHEYPLDEWTRDGIRVWNFNGLYWLVDALDQGGLKVEFHTIEHLDEFWRACRKPPLIESTPPEQVGEMTQDCTALDGKHYWNCWTRNYQAERDGYCIHAFCEEDRSGKTLCGVVANQGGLQAFPHDDDRPSCQKCYAIMVKRGALKEEK